MILFKSPTFTEFPNSKSICHRKSRCTGSLRPPLGSPHLHGEFNFAKSIGETAEQSLRHSCRTPIMRQGISLP